MLEILLLSIILIILIVILFILIKFTKTNKSKKEVSNINNDIIVEIKTNYIKIEEKIYSLEKQIEKINSLNNENKDKIIDLLHSNHINLIKSNENSNERILLLIKESLKDFSFNVTDKITNIQTITDKNLQEIKKNVDEKLEKTLDNRLKQSFNNVISQISSVDKAIGEIKGLASDVGSLKNVLTNVKTKGIIGEVILSNIIKEVLTKEQYEENFATKKNSSERVEFAVKIITAENNYVYLPIDSKFPLESYNKIKDGIEKADINMVENARKELKNKIKIFAKDINNKYIDVPNTTDFAIMFLPIEGLYIEVLEMGLFEEIQREYKVNIVGPSTLLALLNALQMGFKSYAIQKRSSEVFTLLEAVKAEFDTFSDVLIKTQKKFNEANDELDKLVGTRTRKIQSKLRDFSSIDINKAEEILEIK